MADELEVTVRVHGLAEHSKEHADNVITNHIVRSLYGLDGIPGEFHYEVLVNGQTRREGPS